MRKTAPRKKIVAKKTEPEALDSTDKAAKGAKAPAKAAAKKKLSDGAFNVGDFVVYPTHGVGRITDLERQEVAGTKLFQGLLRRRDHAVLHAREDPVAGLRCLRDFLLCSLPKRLMPK